MCIRSLSARIESSDPSHHSANNFLLAFAKTALQIVTVATFIFSTLVVITSNAKNPLAVVGMAASSIAMIFLFDELPFNIFNFLFHLTWPSSYIPISRPVHVVYAQPAIGVNASIPGGAPIERAPVGRREERKSDSTERARVGLR